jgi:hypothetical protein
VPAWSATSALTVVAKIDYRASDALTNYASLMLIRIADNKTKDREAGLEREIAGSSVQDTRLRKRLERKTVSE